MAKRTFTLRYVRTIDVRVNIEAEDFAEAMQVRNRLHGSSDYWALVDDTAHELEADAFTDYVGMEETCTGDVSLTESDIEDMLAQ